MEPQMYLALNPLAPKTQLLSAVQLPRDLSPSASAMSNASNDKRARVNTECREALATHIYERLGLVVQPSDVRLRPLSSRKRGYAWSVAESQKHLFEKDMSNASLATHEALMQQIGISIEAITPELAEATLNQGDTSDETYAAQEPTSPSKEERLVPIVQYSGTSSESFLETIQRLRYENLKFANELGQARAELQLLSEQKEQWDSKSRALQEQLVTSQSRADQLEKDLYQARGNIAGAIDILQNEGLRNPTPRKRMRNIQ